MPKPILKKKCVTGFACGNSCIERADDCNTKVSPTGADLLNKLSSKAGFNEAQKVAFLKIISQTEELFNTERANLAFTKAALNYKTLDDTKLLGDLRHLIKTKDGLTYDSILDQARAESGLDTASWTKVYNSAKNKITGQITKKLMAAKPCD